ncbi:uncharacterized protein LOC62_04G005345 [Vanrija pseudolonga]|uniref:Uncharacterized protein n=1 Tax=Vanrija pseudolonga TaxID=143232 RepID=A0AAF0Y9G6_9TREE|nr:hypothetical protein LOC62_04G005345 [Vanrija pseudolonga]
MDSVAGGDDARVHIRNDTQPPGTNNLTAHLSPKPQIPEMPIIIDHTAYPLLMDLIIGYAPPESLKQLSATSRSLRRRLLHHAELKVAPGAKKVKVPGQYDPQVVTWGDNENIHPPFVLTAADSGQTLPLLPAAVRVLDQVTTYRPSPALGDAFTSIATLRRMNGAFGMNGSSPFHPALTVVDFVRVAKQEEDPRVRWNGESKINAIVPPGTTRYILHMRVDDPATKVKYGNQIVVVNNFVGVEDLVFVCWFPGPKVKGQRFNSTFLYSAVISALEEWSGTGLSVTIVGLERAHNPPKLDTLWTEMGRYVSSAERTYGQETEVVWWGDGERKEQVRSAIRSLAVEQWWAELGSERKDIEGVWPAAADREPLL